MADQARLNDLLDVIDEARKRGDKDTEAKATAAFRRDSMPEDRIAQHEQMLATAENNLAAEKNAAGPQGPLHKALTAADIGLGAVSGVATPILAGAAGLEATALKNAGMNTDPAAVRQKILANGYKTHAGYGADLGAATSEGIANVAAPVVGPIVSANKSILSHLSPEWQDKLKGLEGLAGDVMSVAPVAGQAGSLLERATAARLPSQVVAQTAPEIARSAGLSVSPSTVNSLAGAGERANPLRRALEMVGGTGEGHAGNIARNRPVVTDIVLQDLGLPAQTPVPNSVTGLEDTIKKATAPYAATYQKVRDVLGPDSIPVDDLADPISRIGRGTESQAQIPAAVEALKQHYSGLTHMSGGQMLDTMSDLRKTGYKAILSDNPDTVAVGNAQLELAKLYESRLAEAADHLMPGLASEFKSARTGFAKSYTAEAARVGNDIDPQAIRKIGERAGANTGGMQLIEHMATHFEPDLQLHAPPASIGSQLARGGFISGGGAAGAAIGGPVGAVIGAAAPSATQGLARMLVRATNGAERVPQIRLGRSLERYYGKEPTIGDPTGGLGLADEGLPSGPRGGNNSDLPAVLAGDMALGEHRPSGLSLAPEQTNFPKTANLSASEADRLAQDLSLAGDHPTGGRPRYSDFAGVASQGVPEGIMSRTPRPGPRVAPYDPGMPTLEDILTAIKDGGNGGL